MVAECRVLPACICQDMTRQDVLENMRDAIALCLEAGDERGLLAPLRHTR